MGVAVSFFLPGRTTCAICHRPIEERSHAARLPFVDPADAGELATGSSSYVHRACWEVWPERDRYVDAAASLLARAHDDANPQSPNVEDNDLVWFRVPAAKAFRLQDLERLVTVDIPAARADDVARWLSDAARGAPADAMTIGDDTWALRPAGNGLELVHTQDGETIEVVEVSRERLGDWADVLTRPLR
jgi:hypothetical protein